jgi:hypothetical protein
MEGDKLIYIIYLMAICSITFYFSGEILQKKIGTPFIGKFIGLSKEDQLSTFSLDEKRLVEKIEEYVSFSTKLE